MGITNTTRDDAHPEWTMGGNPGAISAQEASGQQELVNSQQLPAEVSPADRKALEEMGVVFGEPVEGDPLFVLATLPAGWTKRPTDHAMWSELVNDGGAVVAKIFYKAAFYDRRATLQLA